MPADRVADLMPQHKRQAVFATVHRLEQAAACGDRGWRGEGVHAGCNQSARAAALHKPADIQPRRQSYTCRSAQRGRRQHASTQMIPNCLLALRPSGRFDLAHLCTNTMPPGRQTALMSERGTASAARKAGHRWALHRRHVTAQPRNWLVSGDHRAHGQGLSWHAARADRHARACPPVQPATPHRLLGFRAHLWPLPPQRRPAFRRAPPPPAPPPAAACTAAAAAGWHACRARRPPCRPTAPPRWCSGNSWPLPGPRQSGRSPRRSGGAGGPGGR